MSSKSNDVAPAPLEREFLPLRTLAQVLTALLAADVVLTVARLTALLINHSEAPWKLGIELKPLAILFHIAVITTEVVFLIWFRRARINAERDCWQRRARPWAFWGWVVPLGHLWIPFQVMRDIWRAGLAPEYRDRTAWLLSLWWASYLLPKAVSLASPDGRPDQRWYDTFLLPENWFSLSFFAIAGILLIAIIRIVSRGPVGWPNAESPSSAT
jgi:hypothetical protein